MLTAQSTEWLRAFIALIGMLSLYMGYRLFCDVSEARRKRSVLATHVISGVLLALFGVGILVADARGFTKQSPAVRALWQNKPARHGSLEAPVLKKAGVDRFA